MGSRLGRGLFGTPDHPGAVRAVRRVLGSGVRDGSIPHRDPDRALRAPLTASMGRSELEHAAAILVLACQRTGAWQALSPQEIGHALRWALDTKREPWPSLNRNPFFRPDFRGLGTSPYVRWSGEDGAPFEFTEAGLAAIQKHTWQAYVERWLAAIDAEWTRMLEAAA